MDTPIETVGAVVLRDTKVLLVRHEAGAEQRTHVYGLPAGRVEEGESLEEAVKRELLEETGLHAVSLLTLPTDYNAHIERKDGTQRHFHMVVFLVREYGGDLKANVETTPLWVERDTLSSLELLPNVVTAIKEAISIA